MLAVRLDVTMVGWKEKIMAALRARHLVGKWVDWREQLMVADLVGWKEVGWVDRLVDPWEIWSIELLVYQLVVQ